MPTIYLSRIVVEEGLPLVQVLVHVPGRTPLAHGSEPVITVLLLPGNTRRADRTHENHNSISFSLSFCSLKQEVCIVVFTKFLQPRLSPFRTVQISIPVQNSILKTQIVHPRE